MEQTFQKPWQITLLRVHSVIDAVLTRIESFFSFLNPNNDSFRRELSSKPALRTVK